MSLMRESQLWRRSVSDPVAHCWEGYFVSGGVGFKGRPLCAGDGLDQVFAFALTEEENGNHCPECAEKAAIKALERSVGGSNAS